jgi:hypothetical protein
MERDVKTPSKINRREMLKRAAVAGGVAWAAPVLTSLRTPAFAQYGDPCEEDCIYVVHIECVGGNCTCSECEGNCGGFECNPPNKCQGSGCARVTSISKEGGQTVICTDCELGPGAFSYCKSCDGACELCSGTAPVDDHCHTDQHSCPEGQEEASDMYLVCSAC